MTLTAANPLGEAIFGVLQDTTLLAAVGAIGCRAGCATAATSSACAGTASATR